MSVDRCTYVMNIIAPKFTMAHEGITGDEPEAAGIYTVRAVAPSMARGNELLASVTQALSQEGYTVRATIEPREDASAALIFRVDVGAVRAAL